MSNTLTLITELHADDRARLDTIIDLLGNLCLKQGAVQHPDEITQALTKAVEEAKPTLDKFAEATKQAQEAAKNAQDALDASTPTENTPESTDDAPAQPGAATEPPTPTVTMDMLRSIAITLAAAGKTVKVREVVHPYAPKVTELPESAWDEVYAKLKALEG